jgi:hypothetical protein
LESWLNTMTTKPDTASSRVACHAERPLVISGLVARSWHASVRRLFAWDDDSSMTGLTSTAGSMRLSPEGGP